MINLTWSVDESPLQNKFIEMNIQFCNDTEFLPYGVCWFCWFFRLILGFKETIFSPLNGWEWKRCLFLSGQPRLYSQHLLMDGITKCLTIPWYVSLYLHHRCHTLSNSHTSLLQFLSLVVCAGEGQGNCCCWTRNCQCRNLRIGFKSVQWMPQQCFF